MVYFSAKTATATNTRRPGHENDHGKTTIASPNWVYAMHSANTSAKTPKPTI
jgi:hypothetical protein